MITNVLPPVLWFTVYDIKWNISAKGQHCWVYLWLVADQLNKHLVDTVSQSPCPCSRYSCVNHNNEGYKIGIALTSKIIPGEAFDESGGQELAEEYDWFSVFWFVIYWLFTELVIKKCCVTNYDGCLWFVIMRSDAFLWNLLTCIDYIHVTGTCSLILIFTQQISKPHSIGYSTAMAHSSFLQPLCKIPYMKNVLVNLYSILFNLFVPSNTIIQAYTD